MFVSPRALFVFAAVLAAPAWAQMPAAVVGGTNLMQAAGQPAGASASTVGSSERQAQTRTRSVGEGTISLGAVSASPGGAAPQEATGGPQGINAVMPGAPSAGADHPGEPIRIRRAAHAPGEAIRATAPAQPAAHPTGPGAPIHVAVP